MEAAGQSGKHLIRLINKVRSADPDNCEAQAARGYWPRLFGKHFRRDRYAAGLNVALNYSYAIVRACVARGLSGAGLHPSFSLHHKNPQNPINLVDDLLEPFRPVSDYMLWRDRQGSSDARYDEMTPETKSALAAITNVIVPVGVEASPLSLATVKTCRSFAGYCPGQSNDFLTPGLPSPLDLAAI